MKEFIKIVLCGVVLTCAASTTSSQTMDEPLVTDRPDITESSLSVGRGVWQIETSARWTRFDFGGTDLRAWTTPTLVRVGVAAPLELRLESPLFTAARTSENGAPDEEATGLSPILLGAKYHFVNGGGAVPSTGALLNVLVPSGSGAFSIDFMGASLLVAADWDFLTSWSFGTNVGIDVVEEDNGEVLSAGFFSGALGKGVGEKTGLFLEFVGGGIGRGRIERTFIVDGGMTFLLGLNAQIDVAVGGGVTKETDPGFYVTVGFSGRGTYLKSAR